jgi:hypothetical protein
MRCSEEESATGSEDARESCVLLFSTTHDLTLQIGCARSMTQKMDARSRHRAEPRTKQNLAFA